MGKPGLRIVTCNAYVAGYQLVAEWAERHGHQLVLLVTLPGTGQLYGGGQQDLIDTLPDGQDVLITKRLRGTAAPVLATLQPDLLVSAAFPRRIPDEMLEIPRLGAVNLHPAPLPRGRGPNPQRMIYEGEAMMGAALHRTVAEFDAGAVLSRRERPLPADITPELVFAGWREMLVEVLEEGTQRVLDGTAGEPQDEALATYAGPFTDEERWLDWNEPASTIQRRATALNMFVPRARVRIGAERFIAADVRAAPEHAADVATPGTVLERDGDLVTVRAEDAPIRLRLRPLEV